MRRSQQLLLLGPATKLCLLSCEGFASPVSRTATEYAHAEGSSTRGSDSTCTVCNGPSPSPLDVQFALTPIGAVMVGGSPSPKDAVLAHGVPVKSTSSQSRYLVRYPWSPRTFNQAWYENRCVLLRVFSGPVPLIECAVGAESNVGAVSEALDLAGGLMVIGVDASCVDSVFLPQRPANGLRPSGAHTLTPPLHSQSLHDQLLAYLENQRELYTPRQVSRMLINAVETDYATEMLPPADGTMRSKLHRALYGPERRVLLRAGASENSDIDGFAHDEAEAVVELYRIVLTPSGSVVQGWFTDSLGTAAEDTNWALQKDGEVRGMRPSWRAFPTGNSSLRQELFGPAVEIGDASVVNNDASHPVDDMLVGESCSLLHTGYLQPDLSQTAKTLSTSVADELPTSYRPWSVEDNVTRFFERKWGYQSLPRALTLLSKDHDDILKAMTTRYSTHADRESQTVKGRASPSEKATLERIGTLYSKWGCNNELAALTMFRANGQADLRDFGSLDKCLFSKDILEDDELPTGSVSTATSTANQLRAILDVESDPAGLLEAAEVHMIFRARQHAKLGGLSYRAAAFDVVDADGFTMYRPDIVAGKTTLVAGLRAGITLFKDRSYGHITSLAPPISKSNYRDHNTADVDCSSEPPPARLLQPLGNPPTTMAALLDLAHPLATSYVTTASLSASPLSDSEAYYAHPSSTYLSHAARLSLLRNIPTTLNVMSFGSSGNDVGVAHVIVPIPIQPQPELDTIADVLVIAFTRVLVHTASWQRVSRSSSAFGVEGGIDKSLPGSAGTPGNSGTGSSRDLGASDPGELGSGPKVAEGVNKRGSRVPLSVMSKGDVSGGGVMQVEGTGVEAKNVADVAMPAALKREPQECLALLFHAFSHSRHRCEVGLGLGNNLVRQVLASRKQDPIPMKKLDQVVVLSHDLDPRDVIAVVPMSHTREARQILSEVVNDFVRCCRISTLVLTLDMLLSQKDVPARATTNNTDDDAERATQNVVQLLKRKREETHNKRRHGGRGKEAKGGGRINSRKALANALKIMNRHQMDEGDENSNAPTALDAAGIVRSKLSDSVPDDAFFSDARSFVVEAAEWINSAHLDEPSSTAVVSVSFSDALDPLTSLKHILANPAAIGSRLLVTGDNTDDVPFLPEESAQLQLHVAQMLTHLRFAFDRYARAHEVAHGTIGEADDFFSSSNCALVVSAQRRVDHALGAWIAQRGTLSETTAAVFPSSAEGVHAGHTSATEKFQDLYNFNNPWGPATNVHLATHRAVTEMLNTAYFSPAAAARATHSYRLIQEITRDGASETENDGLALLDSIDPLQLTAEAYCQRYLFQTIGNRTALEQALFRYRYAGSDDQYCFERAMKVLPQPLSDVVVKYSTATTPSSDRTISSLDKLADSAPSPVPHLSPPSQPSFVTTDDGELESDRTIVSRVTGMRRSKELSDLLRGDNADDYVDEVPKGLSHQGGALGLLADREAGGGFGSDIMRARGNGSPLDSPFEHSEDANADGLSCMAFNFEDDELPLPMSNHDTDAVAKQSALQASTPSHHQRVDTGSPHHDPAQRQVSLFRQLSLVSVTGRSFRWGSIADTPILLATPFDPIAVSTGHSPNSAPPKSKSTQWYQAPKTYRRRRRILPYSLTKQVFGVRHSTSLNQGGEKEAGGAGATTIQVPQTAKERLSRQIQQLLSSGLASLPQGLLVPSYSNVPDYEGEATVAASAIQTIRFPTFRVREAPSIAVETVAKNVPYLLPPPLLSHHGRRSSTASNGDSALPTLARHVPKWKSATHLGLESYVWTRRVALGFEGRYVYSTLLRVMLKEAVNNAKLGFCFKTSSITGRSLPTEVKSAAFLRRISSPPIWAADNGSSPSTANLLTPPTRRLDASLSDKAVSKSLVPFSVQSVTVLPQSSGLSISAGNHTEGWLDVKRSANAISLHSTLVASCLILRKLKLVAVKPHKAGAPSPIGSTRDVTIPMQHPITGAEIRLRITPEQQQALLVSALGTAAASISTLFRNFIPAVVTVDPANIVASIRSLKTRTNTINNSGSDFIRGCGNFNLVCDEILGNGLSSQFSHVSSDSAAHSPYEGNNDTDGGYTPPPPHRKQQSALLLAMTSKLNRKSEKANRSMGAEMESKSGADPAPHSLATLPDPVRDQVASARAGSDGWAPPTAATPSYKSPANLSGSMTADGMTMEAAFIVAENRQVGGLKSLKIAASALISTEDDTRLEEDFVCASQAAVEAFAMSTAGGDTLLSNEARTEEEEDRITSASIVRGQISEAAAAEDRPEVGRSHLLSTASFYKGLTKASDLGEEDGGMSPFNKMPKSMQPDEIYSSLEDDHDVVVAAPAATTPLTVLPHTNHDAAVSSAAQPLYIDTSHDHPLERLAVALRDVVVPYKSLIALASVSPTDSATVTKQLAGGDGSIEGNTFSNARNEVDFEHLPLNLLTTAAALDLGAFNISDFTDVAREIAGWCHTEQAGGHQAAVQSSAHKTNKSKNTKDAPQKKKKQTKGSEPPLYELHVEEMAVVFKGAMYLPSVAFTDAHLLEQLIFN